MSKFNWKYLFLIVLLIPAANYFAGFLGRSAAERVNAKEVAGSAKQSSSEEIRVVVSSQDAEGLTRRNFDMTFLKNLEAYTVAGVKTKSKEYFASQGHPNTEMNFTSEANYVESGQTKFAVIRLRGSDGSKVVSIAGIIGKEFKRVTCVRNSGETIPISYGVCGQWHYLKASSRDVAAVCRDAHAGCAWV